MTIKIPTFSIHCSNPNHSKFGYIAVDGHTLDILADCNAVYMHLGYTADMAKGGILPEEFIWHEYTKDGAAKSKICLQSKIVEYLNEHSAIFKDKFGEAYKKWAGSCSSRKTDDSVECADCHMYPTHEADKHSADVYPINSTQPQDTPAQARYCFRRMASTFGIDDPQADLP